MSDEKHDFYVYTYAYQSVFYVGKGRKDRIFFHEKEARKGHQCQRCHFIREIIAQGSEIIKTKVYEHLSEAEAYKLEAQVIELYGYANLMNRQRGHIRPFHRREKAPPSQYVSELYIDELGKRSIISFDGNKYGDRERVIAWLRWNDRFEEVVEVPV